MGGVIVNNILLWFRRHENIYKFALRVIVVFIILSLSVALLGMLWLMMSVMLDSDIKADFMGYTGYSEKDKPELIKLIGLGMSGIIATLGVVGLLRRAASLDEQNKLTEKGHVHERFKAATEHIGNEKSISARIASFNEFYHIAEIELDLRKTSFDILCAHLRQTTKHEDYKSNLKPTEEMQSLLDILFKPKNKNILIFSGLDANLAEANLQGADLQKANLQDAKMKGVNLQGADLEDANLEDANLEGANLQKADMLNANLQSANLQGANLQSAKIQSANLQTANLEDANLQDANLQNADLQSANLQDAELQYADLEDVNLEDANMEDANLEYAKMQDANLQSANLQTAKMQTAKMQGVNLRYADLQYANLEKATLRKANLQYANLEDANLQYANLEKANLEYANLLGADLLGAKINRETTVMPDNWKSVVKLYDDEDGEKRPMVNIVDDEGNH